MSDAIDFQTVDLDTENIQALLQRVFEEAVLRRASDVFFLTDQDGVRVVLRLLGEMKEFATLSRDVGRSAITAVKTNGNMNIAESRRPQDGRFLLRIRRDGRDAFIDVRANSIPTLYGEDVTSRILDRERNLLPLEHLGLSTQELRTVQQALDASSGLIAVTGPTGVGKTTTIYAILRQLANGKRKINTLEDPIEYALAGVRQSQVDYRADLDFPKMLRNVLRQGPDVIMIGEIRDEETAETAIRAANSGHLVLATLHASTAPDAVQSLRSLNIHPYFLSMALRAVISQRLVRTLCMNCRVKFESPDLESTFSEIRDSLTAAERGAMYGHKPGGCERCLGEGYASFSGLFEILPVGPQVRSLIAEGRTSRQIYDEGLKHGLISFRKSALIKVAKGQTSLEEVMRRLPADRLQETEAESSSARG
jgi:type II secretory ATPase GspE/PulE/Tfp pilus assembly ATPase PilB-like protein